MHSPPVPSTGAAGDTLPLDELGNGARPRMGTFYSLQFSSFRFLWIGSFFSSLGQWIQQTTLGWVVYDLTGSGSLLGLINGMRSLPMLVFSPLGGVSADRVNRKALMMFTQVFLMVISFALAIDIAMGKSQIWHLFVFTALTGVAWAFNMPVRQSVIFDLVPRYAFPNAVALNSAAFNSTRILGPTAAGLLIGSIGAHGNFFVQGLAFLGVAVLITLMIIPATTSNARSQSVGRNLKEGLSFVLKDRTTLTLMVMGLFPVFFAMPYSSLMPIFVKDIYHGGSSAYGMLLSAAGAGGLLGGLFTASLGNFERRGLLQIAAMAGFGGGIFAFSFVDSLWLGAVLMAVTGFFQLVFMTTNNTLLQMNIPSELRGRITSLVMLDQGLVPLGTLLAGIGADFAGAPLVVMIMGIACVALAGAVALWVPSMRNMCFSGASRTTMSSS